MRVEGFVREEADNEPYVSTASDGWVMRPGFPAQAQLRLFCFPYAGGGVSTFRGWEQFLPPAVELCPVQFPGRENRRWEPAFTRLSTLIQTLVDVLSPYMDMPFAFFGHSLGALVSFELARQLRRYNKSEPLHLFASGRKAPQMPRNEPAISTLPDAAFIEELRCYNGTPEEVLRNTELLNLYLPLLRADFSVYESYVYSPEPPLSCSISAFGGTLDRKVSWSALMSWREQTSSAFSLRMFHGDHFFLSDAATMLLRALSQDLTLLLRMLD